jgi:hypothetical protein
VQALASLPALETQVCEKAALDNAIAQSIWAKNLAFFMG